jgi:hypothetical protein
MHQLDLPLARILWPGIRIRCADADQQAAAQAFCQAALGSLGLPLDWVVEPCPDGRGWSTCLRLGGTLPGCGGDPHDSLGLARLPGLAAADEALALTREIVLALLLHPLGTEWPSLDEWQAHVRMRRDIALAARRTELAFETDRATRPESHWREGEERGYVVRPDVSVIDALRAATQPQPGQAPHAFSCYRATEYVILLGIAQELQRSNPALLERLQRQCERHLIRSGAFHDHFLDEVGDIDKPMPPRYYVPGDRVWFRNPDEASADVVGFEGSWVIYLGRGQFANFWHREAPFTLEDKCLEIYHWRDGTYLDAAGEPRMDEHIVQQRVQATRGDPARHADVLARMMRIRDLRGVYADGGCIDASREQPRLVCPATATLILPSSP